jgi:hypothetical protein
VCVEARSSEVLEKVVRQMCDRKRRGERVSECGVSESKEIGLDKSQIDENARSLVT